MEAYARHKRDRALLDYDDLILRARDLLQGQGAASWVLFKLDGGLDHILIDEAQDTNPEQWDVVRLLAEEFFAGEGPREGPRTVFAVGEAEFDVIPGEFTHPVAKVRDEVIPHGPGGLPRRIALGPVRVDVRDHRPGRGPSQLRSGRTGEEPHQAAQKARPNRLVGVAAPDQADAQRAAPDPVRKNRPPPTGTADLFTRWQRVFAGGNPVKV